MVDGKKELELKKGFIGRNCPKLGKFVIAGVILMIVSPMLYDLHDKVKGKGKVTENTDLAR